jgi:hypothetical protein
MRRTSGTEEAERVAAGVVADGAATTGAATALGAGAAPGAGLAVDEVGISTAWATVVPTPATRVERMTSALARLRERRP